MKKSSREEREGCEGCEGTGETSESRLRILRGLRATLSNCATIFRDDGVVVLVSRRTATQEPQRFRSRVPQLVLLPGRNRDGVAGAHVAEFIADADAAAAVSEVIDFLGFRVEMFLCA